MPKFADLRGELGGAYDDVRISLEDMSQVDIYNHGVRRWNRATRNGFRVEWRCLSNKEFGTVDLEVNFYDVAAVDPQGEFEREKEFGEGDITALPVQFCSFLREIVKALPPLGPDTPNRIHFIEETLSWSLVLPNKGLRNAEALVSVLLDTIELNLPHFSSVWFI